MTKQILKQISEKPIPYWIYLGLSLLSSLACFLLHPQEPGLYTDYIQVIPLAVALAFSITCTFLIRGFLQRNLRSLLYTYSLLQFLFLALDYNIYAHAGLIQIALTIIPPGIFWTILFLRWNYRCIQEAACRRALIVSAIAWGLYAFAFPPLPLGPSALVLLVPWFVVLNRFSRSACIFATFWSGIIYNTINYYWIYNVMNVETAPSGLICFGVFLLIAYFSAYNVLAAFVYTLAREVKFRGWAFLLVLYPIFYAGLEMTRTRGDFAFPWSHLGYAFGNHIELIQMLSTIGIFGYTAIVIASNMIAAKALERPGLYKKWPVTVPMAIFAILAIHGKVVLSSEDAIPFSGCEKVDAPRIAMVQPSIKQGEKWSKARFDSITTKTFGMINDSIGKDVDLIILAETAIPDHIRRQPKTIRELHRISENHNAAVLTGALDYKRNEPGSPRKYDIYNASFLFTPDNFHAYQRYIKKHLVPFSERIPFDDVFPILNYVDLGEGDFVPGKETPVYGPFKWTPFICYDAIFGDLVREAINAGSRLMVNITNDGWFGKSTAPFQHLNLVRYRAVENGMPTVRLANSGISSFIDQYGHYDQNTKIFTDRVIQRKMQLKTRDTLYKHIGDSVETLLLWFFLLYFAAAAFASTVQRRKAEYKN